MQDAQINLFAYGSLMWKPDFPCGNTCAGKLEGYHRDFCLYSYMYCGSVDSLGLVLGLKTGGHGDGWGITICDENLQQTLSEVWDREMVIGHMFQCALIWHVIIRPILNVVTQASLILSKPYFKQALFIMRRAHVVIIKNICTAHIRIY